MKIIAFYSEKNSNIGPVSPAAINKLDYIIDSLIRRGKNVELFSLCTISQNKKVRKHSININENFLLKYQTCSTKYGFISKVYHKIFDSIKVLLFLSKNINKNEEVFLYHCNNYLKIIKHIIKTKKAKLVLEVEEIYGDVANNKKLKNLEFKIFGLAKSFIFSSESLDRKININNKPSLIVYGPYLEKTSYNSSFNDTKVHCVYAGTFNIIKGGADNAIKSALYLNNKYQIHILGFGNEVEKNRVLSLINEVNKKSDCKVIFEGLLMGAEYDRFLQKCSIGLSTQNSNGAYNESSFPSKILSFMANNLRVVTYELAILKESSISKFMYYYNNDDAKSIAETIKSIDLEKQLFQREYLKKLDNEFLNRLNQVFEANE